MSIFGVMGASLLTLKYFPPLLLRYELIDYPVNFSVALRVGTVVL